MARATILIEAEFVNSEAVADLAIARLLAHQLDDDDQLVAEIRRRLGKAVQGLVIRSQCMRRRPGVGGGEHGS